MYSSCSTGMTAKVRWSLATLALIYPKSPREYFKKKGNATYLVLPRHRSPNINSIVE